MEFLLNAVNKFSCYVETILFSYDKNLLENTVITKYIHTLVKNLRLLSVLNRKHLFDFNLTRHISLSNVPHISLILINV